jgi:hypothetical protein
VRQHGAEQAGFVVGVFHDAEAGEQTALLDHAAADAFHDLVEGKIHERAVINLRALVFTEADEQHLHEAALVVAEEFRVRLHAADDDDVIRRERVAPEVDGHAFPRAVEQDGFHARADRAAAEFLGDAVVAENFALALGRAAAVAAHRGDDERLRPERAEEIHRRAKDHCDVRDAAAARRERDALAGLHTRRQVQPRELRVHRRRNVRDERPREFLPHAEDAWVGRRAAGRTGRQRGISGKFRQHDSLPDG